jgi:Flp pilus assembly pilin Flp
MGLHALRRDERGVTLIETAFALGLMIVTMIGLMSMGTIATVHTENQGHLAARTTEYAQDKMEQLLSLAYTDTASNTVVFPAASSGGTGLAVGGSSTTSTPVNGYVDWLALDGSLLGGGTTAPGGWFYERVWQVSSLTSSVKLVTVTVTVRSSIGATLLPKATVTATKASQF